MSRQYSVERCTDDDYLVPVERSDETSVFEDVEHVLTIIKPYGRFQRMLNVLMGLIYAPVSVQMLMVYFIASESSWRCAANSSVCLRNGTFSSSNKDNCEMDKSEWEFTEKPEFSIITYFGLYCEDEWLVHATASSVFIGWSVGSFFISWVADNYGRKLVIFPSFIVIILVGFLSIFSPNVHVFIVSRFIVGLFLSGNAHVLYIMMAEFVDTDHRPLAVISITSSYTLWVCLLCLQAYFIRDWKLLTMTCTLPYLVIVVFYKFVPESIHWLHLHGLHKELKVVLRRMSYWNKTVLPEDFKIIKTDDQFAKPKLNPLELFRTATLRIQTNKLIYAWVTVGMCYFSLSLAANDLSGSLYRDFFIINAIELPSNIITVYCSGRFGRKKTVSTNMIAASLACLAVAFTPATGKIKIIRLILGVFGKGCVTIVFNGFLSWTIELYGTDVRANAMGVLNVAARIGAATSPWVAKALKHISPMAPFIFMGCFGFIAGCVMCTLPETKGVVLRSISSSDDREDDKLDEKNP